MDKIMRKNGGHELWFMRGLLKWKLNGEILSY